ncbi:DEAD/DEAH box helicase [Polaromonas sp.]|uniref:DEAD/DEAH box helicase n=1 Tax=Polaromonas sp. TaxID=1869339 RepID=UPI003C9107E0
MKVNLPAVFGVDINSRLGRVRQIAVARSTIEGRPVKYTLGKAVGHVFQNAAGTNLLYLFATHPSAVGLPSDAPVLVVKNVSVDVQELDLTDGKWVAHSAKAAEPVPPAKVATAARSSWLRAFQFAEEDQHNSVVGLRKPQAGALHAIHAHWSTSDESATVVMPTGTGKTETMLAVLTSAGCERVLVIVPTDALRSQLADKFETLGLLKVPGNAVLAEHALRPVVGTLTSKPKTIEEVDSVFLNCNVVVTTSHLVGGCEVDIQDRLAALCSHLFIDEAHHAEAETWKAFRERFDGKLVLQFTATPFREDGQAMDGKLVYVYPLRKAQQEGYFSPIRFHAVREFNSTNGDRKIAMAALDELDADSTGKHIVMARVSDTRRASIILALYQSFARHRAVAIHSGMSKREQLAAKGQLFDGSARVVVCVDMLGEGFDLPELKIAAFHDIRKSLAVTLQLAGRFTRARLDLGAPVFIANIALVDVRDELRRLYSQDPDWNVLLPELSTAAIDAEQISQDFFRGFGTFLDEVPLNDLRPAASMVVYKTNCTNWTPQSFKRGLRGLTTRDKIFHSLNEVENTLVFIIATEQGVRWSDVESIRETVWEMIVAIWDRERALLYLHGSGLNGEYKEIAKALCGQDVRLVVAPEIFRSFHGVKRLILNNVGLNEHLGRQVQYTGRMGSDVESRIGQAARRGAKRAVLAGGGFEHGATVSIGAAKRGRVWSNLRLRVDTFAVWARAVGAKIVDETIDPDAVLAGTLKPVPVGAAPAVTAVAVDWPNEVLERPETGCRFSGVGIPEEYATNVDIEVLARGPTDPLLIRVFSDRWECVLGLDFFPVDDSFDFQFVHVRGIALNIALGAKDEPLTTFFTEHAPVVWFADGSSLEGCEFTQLPTADLQPYNPAQLQVVDWSGVNIRAESQGESRRVGTIQHSIIQRLQNNSAYAVIFDDDGSNEAADVVAITIDRSTPTVPRIEVELYHLKYAGGEPGRRLEDLYVVCGQAQRSTTWLANHGRRTDLFTHLLSRNDQRVQRGAPTRFERGTEEVLLQIREMSRRSDVRLSVYVVQPGLSKAQASHGQLMLLAVTERFLSDTYEIPFSVMCSP